MRLPRYSRRFVSLVLVIIVTGYWGFSGDSALTPTAEGPDVDPVDSYLSGALIRQFDGSGQLSRTLESSRIEHLTATDSNRFTAPILRLQRDQRPPVQITAEEGESSSGNSLIELRRQVRIQEQAPTALRMDTELLYVKPDRNFAWTGEPVAYFRGNSTTHAVGMNAYLDHNRVELLNDVRGHYETR